MLGPIMTAILPSGTRKGLLEAPGLRPGGFFLPSCGMLTKRENPVDAFARVNRRAARLLPGLRVSVRSAGVGLMRATAPRKFSQRRALCGVAACTSAEIARERMRACPRALAPAVV